MIRRPAMASAMASYSACCSSMSGAVPRPRNRNSVRTSPAPSAPAASEDRASATEPTLATTANGVPSGTTAGRSASARCWARRWARSAARRRNSSSSSGEGSIRSSPELPSRMMVVPSGTLSTSRPAATTTGCRGPGPGWPRATWDSLREHDPGHQVGIQPGRLGGRQVARDEHPSAIRRRAARRSVREAPGRRRRGRPRRAPAGTGRAGRPLGARRRRGSRPRRRRPDAGADARLDVGEHLGVGQQRQVRVEDARLLGAHLAGREDPDVLDLPAYGGDRLHDASPLRGRLPHHGLAEGRRARSSACGRVRSRCLVTRGAGHAAAAWWGGACSVGVASAGSSNRRWRG